MAPPKRKCLFPDVLKREYPFLISDETDVIKVRCTLCKSVLSISHGCRNDIEKHIRAKKHKESVAVKALSKEIDSFLWENPQQRTAFIRVTKDSQIRDTIETNNEFNRLTVLRSGEIYPNHIKTVSSKFRSIREKLTPYHPTIETNRTSRSGHFN
jgi:hypothetical protein